MRFLEVCDRTHESDAHVELKRLGERVDGDGVDLRADQREEASVVQAYADAGDCPRDAQVSLARGGGDPMDPNTTPPPALLVGASASRSAGAPIGGMLSSISTTWPWRKSMSVIVLEPFIAVLLKEFRSARP